jgi:hypothetical protein
MGIIPEPSVDPSTWHPSWCSSDHCSAPDRLAERGLTEADIPLHKRHSHFSAPLTIGSEAREDAVLTLALERFVDQPPAEPGVDAVELVMEHRLHGTRAVALLEPAQLDSLAGAVEHLRLLVLGTSPSLVDRAIRALRDFGVHDRDAAHRLLPDWRASDQLDDDEYEQIIGAFPPPPVYDGPREIPWPAELDPNRPQDER